jgi:hypothetical protein
LFAAQAPSLQVSGLSQSVLALLPHDVPLIMNTSLGHAPVLAPHVSATSQPPACAARHTKLDASLLLWQLPEPLQVSGLSQSVSALLPHDVPLDANASLGHAPVFPLPQVSAGSQVAFVPAARHTCVLSSLLALHAPAPSQESGLSQSVLVLLPHGVSSAANRLVGHAPVLPKPHVSATSQPPATAARHTKLADSLLAWHVPAPSQVSALSQSVLLLLPHGVSTATNKSVGHAPVLPEPHVSATSQPPATAARHTWLAASLLVSHAPAPSQVSALSQSVSALLPQGVPLLALPPAWHEPD